MTLSEMLDSLDAVVRMVSASLQSKDAVALEQSSTRLRDAMAASFRHAQDPAFFKALFRFRRTGPLPTLPIPGRTAQSTPSFSASVTSSAHGGSPADAQPCLHRPAGASRRRHPGKDKTLGHACQRVDQDRKKGRRRLLQLAEW